MATFSVMKGRKSPKSWRVDTGGGGESLEEKKLKMRASLSSSAEETPEREGNLLGGELKVIVLAVQMFWRTAFGGGTTSLYFWPPEQL